MEGGLHKDKGDREGGGEEGRRGGGEERVEKERRVINLYALSKNLDRRSDLVRFR